jgi:heme oxygenase
MCDAATVCASARSCARKLMTIAQRARTALALTRGMLQLQVATCTPGLMARLRDATAMVREDRELLAGRVSWLDYRLYLIRMYGFHAAVERALCSTRQLVSVVADASLRNHKAALLAADLVALGVDRRDLAQLPRMMFAAPLALPEALGWTYVVESATLAGKQLVRHLARQLPGEIQIASAFLRCYGDEAPERWRQLGAALDAFELAARDGDRVIDAARDGFIRLRTWVHPALQPRPNRIHA